MIIDGPVPETAVAQLRVISSPDPTVVGRVYRLDKSLIRVGRMQGVEIRISFENIGRVNGVFFLRDESWWVVDTDHHYGMPTTNGTWLRGELLKTPVRLVGGEVIRIGCNKPEWGALGAEVEFIAPAARTG